MAFAKLSVSNIPAKRKIIANSSISEKFVWMAATAFAKSILQIIALMTVDLLRK